MADYISSERLEELRAISQALLEASNQPRRNQGYAGGISSILQALSGHAGLSNVERLRQENLGNLGQSYVSPDRELTVPDAGATNGASIGGPAIGSYTSRVAPSTMFSSPTSPSRAVEIMQQASRVGAQRRIQQRRNVPIAAPEETGSISPQIGDFNTTVTPSSPIITANALPNAPAAPQRRSTASTQESIPTIGAHGDNLNTFRRLNYGANASPVQAYLISKYGPNFVHELYKNRDSSIPIRDLFARHGLGDSFTDSIPPNLLQGDPNKLSTRDWLNETIRRVDSGAFGDISGLTSAPSQQELLSGRSNLGGPTGEDTNAQPDITIQQGPTQDENPLATNVGTAVGAISPAGGTNEPIEAGSTGTTGPAEVTGRGPTGGGGAGASNLPVGPQTEVPPSIAILPVNRRRIQALEEQLTNRNLYLAMTPEQRQKTAEEYGQLTAPQRVDLGHIVAYYDGVTGQLITQMAKPFPVQTGTETITGFASGSRGFNGPNFGLPRQSGTAQPGAPQQPGASQPGASQPGAQSTPLGTGYPEHPITGELSPALQDYQTRARTAGETYARRYAEQDKLLDTAIGRHDNALELIQNLNTIDTLTQHTGPFEAGGIYRGPGQAWFNNAMKVLNNLGFHVQASDNIPSADGITKIITQLGSAATRELSNRPANFEFQTFLKAFPGLETSYEGARMLIDILRQTARRDAEIAQLAEEFRFRPPEQRGSWLKARSDFINSNPIMITLPDGPWLRPYRLQGQGPIRVTTAQVSREQEANMPNNLYFYRDGKLHRGNRPVQ